ncbi:hypothetical protein F2Q70_00024962 [Brassica cretica]|uniref:Uncharacterized protein n=1 Tax=Brassica cretica TaxID=69181 RepID=A0A8S9LDC9_BRACR|nr:hypothetical protein F2Q70_00024962 [Brassica cretica]
MGVGLATLAWAHRRRGRSKTGEAKGRSDGQKKGNRFQIVRIKLRIILGMMEDHLGGKKADGKKDRLGAKRDDKNHTVDDSLWNAKVALVLRNDRKLPSVHDYYYVLIRSWFLRCRMSSPVHHELGERRMRYGPKGTRAYARKPYCDAWGEMVHALFPDEEEMKFAEQPNAPI